MFSVLFSFVSWLNSLTFVLSLNKRDNWQTKIVSISRNYWIVQVYTFSNQKKWHYHEILAMHWGGFHRGFNTHVGNWFPRFFNFKTQLNTAFPHDSEAIPKNEGISIWRGWGTIAIFIVRQMMQKDKSRKIDLLFNFIDFTTAFDTVLRKAQ